MLLPSDPVPYTAGFGFLATLLLYGGLKGQRGLIWSFAVGLGAPLLFWIYAVAAVLIEDGGASAVSRFTIWAGLGMGVPMTFLFYCVGAIPAVGVVAIVRGVGEVLTEHRPR